ncbi:MAG: hypothetical protein K1X61_00020 [Chitinophagales bacterium]|nr:hypothetical protein [Chitinophagales bacterium]
MTPSIVSEVLSENPSAVSGTRLALVVVAFAILTSQAQSQSEQRFPDVIGVKVKVAAPGVFDFDVTVSSPYDTPSRYADGFRISTTEGKVLGERKLLHDHQTEQPFTRDLHSVKIPDGIVKVVVQARDQKYGYGGKTLEVLLPER